MSLPREPIRRRSARRHWEERFGPNMTPMIDVVLVILIFFMAGSTFLGQEWFIKSEMLKRGSPATKQDPLQLPPTRLELRLERTAAGTAVVSVENTTMELAKFADWISGFAKDTSKGDIIVIIEPRSTDAGRVTYEEVVRVHEACVAAGIDRVGVADQAPSP